MFCGTENNKRMEDIPEDSKKIENYYYSQSDKVGQGNFSQVYRGVDQNTGMNVAVKVIKYSSLTTKVAEQLLRNQVSILKQLNHPNIIRCYDVFSSKNNCYIVTDFYEGGDLEKLIFKNKYLHQKHIGRLIYEIYNGLLYLNQLNIIHRDFKPANIFLDASGTPKIADFGFAVKADKSFKDISIGSPIYMSPEGLILHQYGPKTDVWAFGIMIYEMLHGQTPLSKCRDEKELKQKVLLPPTFREGLTPQIRKMLDLCLTVDPKFRIDIKQIAKTAYMSKLISEFSGKEKDLTCTYHTNSTKTKNALEFVKQVKTYEEGLALLQYCRLIHKTSQKTPSPILSQWLLNICWNLQKIKLEGGDREQNQKLLATIHDYYVKYHKEHKDNHIDVGCEEVIVQCQSMINQIQASLNVSTVKIKINNLMMLLRQSQMLIKYGDSNKLSVYVRATQVEKYLQSLKALKSAGMASMPGNQNIIYNNK